MGNQLKAGTMGDAGVTGMPLEFENSLAAAIEVALNNILAAEGKITFDLNDNSRQARDRRMLFVAIAQGLVNHLTANEAAFVIKFHGLATDETIDIQTE